MGDELVRPDGHSCQTGARPLLDIELGPELAGLFYDMATVRADGLSQQDGGGGYQRIGA
jgi:hypothetical protein